MLNASQSPQNMQADSFTIVTRLVSGLIENTFRGHESTSFCLNSKSLLSNRSANQLVQPIKPRFRCTIGTYFIETVPTGLHFACSFPTPYRSASTRLGSTRMASHST